MDGPGSCGADNLTGMKTELTFRRTMSVSIGTAAAEDWAWARRLSLAVSIAVLLWSSRLWTEGGWGRE